MKKIIIALLTAGMLSGCGKEKELKGTGEKTPVTNETKKMVLNKKALHPGLNDSSNHPMANVLPCIYYPPGSPFSCNPGGITDDPVPIYPTIGYSNTYLSFNTLDDFTKTYVILDSMLENFSGYDYAMNLFGGDPDKIDSLLDLRGIDESKSLRDFEIKFSGYNSLRKDLETRENNFLDNGGDPGSISNPENTHFINDDIFRTLLNKDGVITIENIIFKIFENGVTYAIMNGSNLLLNKLMHPENYGLATYQEYFSNHICKIDTANIKLITLPLYCYQPREENPSDVDICTGFGRYNNNTGLGCRLWYQKQNDVFYGNNKKKYVSKIAVYNLFVYDAGISKIKNYKQKKNGKWKPMRANLSAYVSEDGCSLYNKYRSTKYRKFRISAKRDVAIITGIGGIFRSLKWMVENIIASSNGSNYFRFFKTATNYGGFFGKNYCNDNISIIQANW